MPAVLKLLSIALFTAMLSGCGGGNEDPPTTKVYKNRGAIQCENTGIPPEVMQIQLTQANIPVRSFACGAEPILVQSTCGAGTNAINVFEIPVSEVGKAGMLSFRLFDELLGPPFTPPLIGREVPCPT